MGATDFFTESRGKNATEAFLKAVEQAQHDFGYGGYTGTIAEKAIFVEIKVPPGFEPRQYAARLVDSDDPRISDKWGPAGCVKLDSHSWLFFGYASC